MTLVKTVCMTCLGKGVIARITTIQTPSEETVEVKCPACKGAGYLMVEGETK